MSSNRFLRLPEVKAEVGLSRATIYRLIANDQFPCQRQLSPRCVGWYASEIEAWKSARVGAGGLSP
jgi:prophage regulatory protein